MNLNEFNQSLEKEGYDPNKASDAVPLAAFVVGPNIKKIATFLRKPRQWVAPATKPLRDQGVWVNNKILVDGDPEDLGIEMALHTMVAEGLIEVANGEYNDRRRG